MSLGQPISAAGRIENPPPLVEIIGSISRSSQKRGISDKFVLQAAARELSPNSLIRVCLRCKIPDRESVEVWHSKKRQRAYYLNLMKCNKVWICPLCASTISERRRELLDRLLNVGRRVVILDDDGAEKTLATRRWFLALATFTVGHHAGESMATVLGRLKKAYPKIWGGRWAMGFKNKYRIKGSLRSIEPTHGVNGWHPHIHTLLVSDSVINDRVAAEMMIDLQIRWKEKIESIGGYVDLGRGVDVRAGDNKVGEYLDKMGQAVSESIGRWSTIAEFVKLPVKKGRAKQPGEIPNRTLTDLLISYVEGDVQAGRLWIEGTSALRNTAAVMASRGLWDLLKAEAKMDDETLNQETTDPTDIVLASLSLDQWHKVIKADQRGELLEIAAGGDAAAVLAFVNGLES